jgi:hypothetical protein
MLFFRRAKKLTLASASLRRDVREETISLASDNLARSSPRFGSKSSLGETVALWAGDVAEGGGGVEGAVAAGGEGESGGVEGAAAVVAVAGVAGAAAAEAAAGSAKEVSTWTSPKEV